MTLVHAPPPVRALPQREPDMSAAFTGIKRQVNELMRNGLRIGSDGEPIAFFCECGDEQCYKAVWLSGPGYDQAREDPSWVALVPDHAPQASSAA
jgi:hypothetical protein